MFERTSSSISPNDRAGIQPEEVAADWIDCPHRLPGEAGIWIFVVGDCAVFTLFFILIMVGQKENPALFARSRAALDLKIGVINTLFLVAGSWLVARAVDQCRRAELARAQRLFLLASASGAAFVANKVFDWSRKIGDGITPLTNDFYMYYYVFTGIHLVHVILAIVGLLCTRSFIRSDWETVNNIRLIESFAIFWHLVDLLWMMLFALFYCL